MSRRSHITEALSAPEAVVDQAPPTEASATKKGESKETFTSKRLTGFTEAAKMVKRPTMRLKPDECSVWAGNARDYELLTEDRVRSLIDSILAEGGNRIPVTVRRVPDGPKPYELIAGTRRHWAVSWLNENNYPDIHLLATIEDLSDEAAFRLADVENREREDISDLERGENYKLALDQYYDGKINRMAERLKLSYSGLRRYIQCTELPKKIVSAFASTLDLQTYHAETLAPLLKSPTNREKMEREAENIALEQSFRLSGEEEPIHGAEVARRLATSVTEKRLPKQKHAIEADGAAIGKIEADQGRKLTLSLTPSSSSLSTDEILQILRPIIEQAKIRKAIK